MEMVGEQKKLGRLPCVKKIDDSFEDPAWKIRVTDSKKALELDSDSERPKRDVRQGKCLMRVMMRRAYAFSSADECSEDE